MAADYLNYVLSNPDLRENAEALGLTNAEMEQWGQTHYENHGQNEGRQNTPTAITNTEGYTQTLGARHYQGRDPNEVLQASVRSAAGGDFDESMWTARETIDPSWNLGQYTAEGWNLDPDNPYKTGILGDTLAVNTGIGQLVPTAAGNQNFIQDRYLDESIANDFPVGWTTPENTWAGPGQLGNYWDVSTNATRDDVGILGRVDPYDPNTAVGPSVSPGQRGGGNIRPPSTGGPPNPTVPSFGYSGYEDWTRFMPTNFGLAEGGGMHYQPWVPGGQPWVPGGQPWVPGGDDVIRSYPPSVSTTGPGPINTSIWDTDTTSSSNTTTDAQGRTWIMSNGQWIPADSDLGSILASGNTSRHPLGHYDSNGMWVGAEGGSGHAGYNNQGQSIDHQGNVIDQGTPWQDTFMASLGNKLGLNAAGTSAEARNFNAGNALTGFQNVGSLGAYPGFNAVSNVTGPVTGPNVTNTGMALQSGPGRYHGQTNRDRPTWEGPLTSVNTISSGDAEVEAQIEAAIEAQANSRGYAVGPEN